MSRLLPVDGFRLADEPRGFREAVILLRGWPGEHADWREVVAVLARAIAAGLRRG